MRKRCYRLGALLALCLLVVLGGVARFETVPIPEMQARIGLVRNAI
ncbi:MULTISPECIES: hypothetical protein [Streptomyces]